MGLVPLRKKAEIQTDRELRGPSAPARVAMWIALLLPLLAAGLLAWHSLGDADIWLHHRIGRDLWAGRGQPANADFTFSSPELEWNNHETLFQLLIAPFGPDPDGGENATIAGWSAIRLLLVLLLVLSLAWGEGRWRGLIGSRAGNTSAWMGPVLLMGLMLLWTRLTLRPELISYLVLVIVIRTIERALAEPRPVRGWRQRIAALLNPRHAEGLLFWLTLVWAWAHGFAALVPVLWLIGALVAPWQRKLAGRPPVPADWPGYLLTLLALLAALMATPSGPAGLLQPLRALGQFGQETVDLRHVISELVPLMETTNALHITILAFQVSLVWAAGVIVLGWGRISLLRILVVIAAAGAAFLAQRNLGFYAVAFCLLHGGWLGLPPRSPAAFAHRFARWRDRLPSGLRGHHAFLAVGISLAVTGWWAPSLLNDDFYLREGVSRRFGGGRTPAIAPVGGAVALDQLGAKRSVANLAAAALTLDFSSTRLFIDGRTEAHSPTDWVRYRRILGGGPDALTELASLRPDAVLIGSAGAASEPLIATLLQSGSWGVEWLGAAGWLFVPHPDRTSNDPDAVIGRAERLETELLAHPDADSPARFADGCLAQSRIWKQVGRIDRQERILRRGLDRRADHPTLLHNLGNILRERGNQDQALRLYSRALAVNPRQTATALNQGACQMALGRFQDAAESFRHCLAIDPEMFQAWVNLGLALQQTGEPVAAREAFERALELRPQDQRLRQFLQQRR